MKKFKNVLFIGIGGGNDVFSNVFAIDSLRRLGWQFDKCSIAGPISPFHYHTVEKTGIEGLFKTTAESRRFLMRRGQEKSIGFIDAHVRKMLDEKNPYFIDDVFSLSAKNGTEGLKNTFLKLAAKFDYFVLVDVGGDVFYRGKQDKHILTPMFDSMVLKAFTDSGLEGILFEAGPGTDGELEIKALKEVLRRYKAEEHPFNPLVIDACDKLYKKYILSARPGRTIPMTIKAYHSSAPFIEEQYRCRGHIGSTRCYKYFPQKISTELCKSFFLVNPALIKNPFAVSCDSPYDWFIKTQIEQRHTNNEANMEYFKSGRYIWQFLTPSPLLEEVDRVELMKQGINELKQGICNKVLMFPADVSKVGLNGSFEMGNNFNELVTISVK